MYVKGFSASADEFTTVKAVALPFMPTALARLTIWVRPRKSPVSPPADAILPGLPECTVAAPPAPSRIDAAKPLGASPPAFFRFAASSGPRCSLPGVASRSSNSLKPTVDDAGGVSASFRTVGDCVVQGARTSRLNDTSRVGGKAMNGSPDNHDRQSPSRPSTQRTSAAGFMLAT